MNNKYDTVTLRYNIVSYTNKRSLVSPSYTNKRPLITIDGTEISIVRINFKIVY